MNSAHLPVGDRVTDGTAIGTVIKGIVSPWHTWVQFDGEDQPRTVHTDDLTVVD